MKDAENDSDDYGLELKPFPEKGALPESRLTSATKLVSLFQTAMRDDSLSAQQRAGINAMIDGKPPFKQSSLRKAGNADRSNINFGEARSRLNQSLTAYNDMFDGMRTLIQPEIPLDMYDDAERINAEEVIADEFTTMFRDWPDLDPRFQLLAREFVAHGVGLGFHKHDYDWKFDTAGWDNFLIPRSTEIGEDKVPWMLMQKDENPSDLYKMIRNESLAKEMGWNVKAVKQSLTRATSFPGKTLPTTWGNEWARLERELKENNLTCGQENNAKVRLIHAWVKEYDGSFSHFIADADFKGSPDIGEQQFLYKKVSRFKSAQNCFTIFCLNIGEGYYHTVRGQGYDMFPFVQTSNKLRNGMLDSLALSNKVKLQIKDPNGLDSAPYTLSGPVCLLSPEVEWVEQNFQDHNRSNLPILQDFAMLMDAVSPTYRSRASTPERQARTKYELQSEQGLESVLSTASVNMFYRSWRRLLRETWRRVQDILRNKRTEFPEVFEFAQRCLRRGVSPQMILAVERIHEVRAIGAGSPGQRQAIFDKGMSLIGTMDEVGRRTWLHETWVSLVGARAATRFFPLSKKARPVEDQKIAELENALMFGGRKIDPLEGENHTVHAMVHLPAIAQSVQALEDWRNGGEVGDITELQPQVEFLALLIPHTEQHVAAMAVDPTRAEQAANARKALQEYAAIWMTYVRQLQKALEKKQAEASRQAQPDPLVVAKLQKMQADLEMAIRKFQQDQQLKVADVQNRIELRNREADQRMALKIQEFNQKIMEDMDSEIPTPSSTDILSNAKLRTPG